MNRTSLAALALILGSTLVHCGGEQKPADAPEPASSIAPAELPPAPTNGPDAGAPPDSAKAASEAPVDRDAPKADPSKPDALSEDQIAAITEGVNVAEIEQGKIARLKSKDPAIQKFAAKMIAGHEEARKNQDKLKLGSAESSLGDTFGTESASAMNTLKSAQGKDFDRAYIDAEVEQHQKLLDALNDKLLPSVKNPDLKAYLNQIQPHVLRHLKEAQEIQQQVGSKTAAVAAGAKPTK